MQLCPDTRACCFGYFLQVQKRFRVTPGRPQELISRRQLYGDRCFGNKSSGITEAHSLPRVWQTRCQNAMECHGICLFHSTLSVLPVRSVSLVEVFTAVLLRFGNHFQFLWRTIKVADEYKCQG